MTEVEKPKNSGQTSPELEATKILGQAIVELQKATQEEWPYFDRFEQLGEATLVLQAEQEANEVKYTQIFIVECAALLSAGVATLFLDLFESQHQAIVLIVLLMLTVPVLLGTWAVMATYDNISEAGIQKMRSEATRLIPPDSDLEVFRKDQGLTILFTAAATLHEINTAKFPTREISESEGESLVDEDQLSQIQHQALV